MNRKGVWILAAVALLAALAGCDLILATPLVLTPVTQAVEIDVDAGGAVATWTMTGGSWAVTVDFGDGAAERYELVRDVETTVTHTYTAIGTYTVRASRGSVTTNATVTVSCLQPVVYRPFWWQGWIVGEHEILHFQVDYRQIGCDAGTGNYIEETGVKPGAGTTYVRLFAWDADGDPIGVFDFRKPLGEQGVWGEWVELPADEWESYVLSVFLNYRDVDDPLLPLAPRACPPDDVWEEGPNGLSPGDPGYEHHNKFLLEARNEYTPAGGEASAAWRIWYHDSSCD
jgi:hypothetical protein